MRDAVEALTQFEDRGACTDAERRAAVWLHDDLRKRGYEAWVETVWVRPQWAGSLFWHAAAGVAVSLAATAVPAIAIAAFVLALSYGAEQLGFPVLGRLFYRRATQTVVVEPPGRGITLWLVARTDAERSGTRRWRPWVPWVVVVALLWVLAMGAVRASDAEGAWIGIVQLGPTVALLAAAALAMDIVLSDWTPGAGPAGGAAVALALHEELTQRPPGRLSVGLLLCPPHALRPWRRSERPVPADTVVVELGSCASGAVTWSARQPQLAAAVGERGERARGGAARLPTLTVRTGRAEPVDEAALEAVYDFVAETVDSLDAALTRSSTTASAVS